MNYDDFNRLIMQKLKDICGDECSVSIYEALKNNSVRLKGISIRDNDNCMAPTIYMDEFYTDYCDGRDIDDIANEILRIYSANRRGPDFDTKNFSDYGWVRDRLFFKLINSRKNLELLQSVPSFQYLDLALIFGVYVGDFRDTFSSVMIRNEHMKLWGVSEEEIRDEALINTPRLLPSAIWTMRDILNDMGVETDDMVDATPMYILSNKNRINGAAAALYDGVLRKFAGNIGSDLYILPSSIHELIIIPKCEAPAVPVLTDMIAEVNDTQVSPEEILSYSLYEYSISEDALMVADVKKVASV